LCIFLTLENPISENANYRQNVIYRVPHLKVLDTQPITSEEKEEGEQVRVENERVKEEKRRAMEQAQAEAAAAAGMKAVEGETIQEES
jgi:hypothetical protein